MKTSLLKFPRMLRAVVTHDTAFTYRMGAGFPGGVNRFHPASILPGLIDAANPPPFYGDPCLINPATNSYRRVLASDTAVTRIDAILVRPFPVQQTTGGMAAAFGSAGAPVSGVADFLEDGFIMVKVVGSPTKKGAVFIWIAAASGAHVQGGFEATASGANTIAIDPTCAVFNGPPDASGITELRIGTLL